MVEAIPPKGYGGNSCYRPLRVPLTFVTLKNIRDKLHKVEQSDTTKVQNQLNSSGGKIGAR